MSLEIIARFAQSFPFCFGGFNHFTSSTVGWLDLHGSSSIELQNNIDLGTAYKTRVIDELRLDEPFAEQWVHDLHEGGLILSQVRWTTCAPA